MMKPGGKAQQAPGRSSTLPSVGVFLSVLLVLAGCVLPGRERAPVPGQAETLPPEIAEEISPDKPFDHRPYELIWSRRHEAHAPQVDFERLMGWRVDGAGAEAARFEGTRELQLWNSFVGKLSWTEAVGHAPLIIRPPEPILIREHFDALDFWVYNETPDDLGKTPREWIQLAALFTDADRVSRRIELGKVNWPGWSLIHIKLDEEMHQGVRHPCTFDGIEVRHALNSGSTALYMDSLSLYTEHLSMLSFDEASPRSYPDPNATIINQNQGSYENRLVREDDTFRFEYDGVDGKLEYRFQPEQGLSGFHASWNGDPVGRVLDGAGIEAPDATQRIVLLRREGSSLRVVYQSGVTYRIRIEGKSLVIDATCGGGTAESLTLGRFSGLQNPRLLKMPYLGGGGESAPAILVTDAGARGKKRTLFAGAWIDWTRSHGSRLVAGHGLEGNVARVNGEVVYDPRTDRRRNEIDERIVVTLSPTLEEVLPQVPHAPGRHLKAASDRLWIPFRKVSHYEEEYRRCRDLARLGIDQVLYCAGGWTWYDNPRSESIGLRTRAALGKGGDEKLLWFIQSLRDLSWSVGLCQNYRDFSPLNAFWDDRAVQRLSNGSWRSAAPANYALKPRRALEWQARIGSEISEKFNPDASFMSAHTFTAPWENTDYDARVPGAGTFLESYLCYGALMTNEAETVNGPVIAGGPFAWLYAGMADGFVMLNDSAAPRSGEPLMPLFALIQLQPKSVRYGLGYLSGFFGKAPADREEAGAMLDEYLATQMAYGHAGIVLDDLPGPDLICRSYYVMKELQRLSAGRRPSRVAYWDGQQLQSPSEAVASGTYRRSQLYLLFPNQLECWINGSRNEDWRVRVGREDLLLPPFGWVAQCPGFRAVSVLDAGGRVDYVRAPDYLYYDGRGRETDYRGLRSPTPLVIRPVPGEKAMIEVLNIGRAPAFGITDMPFGKGNPVRCDVFGVLGRYQGELEIMQKEGLYWFEWTKGAFCYRITLSE